MVSHERRREVSAFISGLQMWAAERDDIVAAAIVGSWARSAAREDSDVDLILLTEDVSIFEGDGWIAELAPAAELARTAEWGAIAERRLRLPSGLEIEVGIGHSSWARTAPVDPGTRAVVRDGLWPVFDPLGLLAKLTAARRFES